MPVYSYKARDQQGQSVTGTVEANSESAAADILVKRKQIPIKIDLNRADQKLEMPQWLEKKVTLTDLSMFVRQMYSLTKSGIPLIRSIVGLAETSTSKALRKVLLDLAEQVDKGRPLSVAMASYPKTFNRLVVSIVHVGENTGRLDEAFLQLHGYFEQEQETRKQIKQATRYPSFVLIAIMGAMTMMNIMVIPKFAEIFKRFNSELPWSTQLLLASSNLFINYWQYMLAALIGLIWATNKYIKSEKGGYNWDKWKLKMPLMGSIIDRATLGRYCRSFSMMLSAGIPLPTALSLVAEAVDNSYIGSKVRDMRKSIERGESLLRASVQSTLFTPLVLQMLAVGEETGQVDEMLSEVANYYEREVSFELKSLTEKIEPILIVVVAAMVLILALGIFTPMWDMMNVYKQQ